MTEDQAGVPTLDSEQDDSVLLDISTLAPVRKLIRIDGVPYQMAHPNDFGVEELDRIIRLQAKASRFIEGDQTRTNRHTRQAENKAMEESLIELSDLILSRVPARIRRKLHMVDRFQVALAFSLAVGKKAPTRPLSPAGASTGENGSPDSVDSTEALAATG